MVDDAVDFDCIQRVLVVKLRHHGDVLLASPVFGALKTHVPGAEIDALVYDDTREMLEEHPAICQVHTIGRNWRKLRPQARLVHELALWRDGLASAAVGRGSRANSSSRLSCAMISNATVW